MRNLNFLRKSERKSVGTTLALTVVRPSFDRRHLALKHLAFMLLFLLGSLNVWGDPVVLFHETFGAGSTSATQTWSHSKGSQTGVDAVMANAGLTSSATNAKQSKQSDANNYTTGAGASLMGNAGSTSAAVTATYIVGPLVTTNCSDMVVSFAVKYGSVGASYFSNLYYSTNNSDWNLITTSGGPTTANTWGVKTSSGTIPAASTIWFKIEYSLGLKGGNPYIDEFDLSGTYSGSSTPKCATPTFSPVAGAVVSGTNVILTTTTEDADIYYTMGVSPDDPTKSSTKYTAPISITEATTIKAIAVKDEMDNSEVASAAYTIVTPYTSIASLADDMTNSDQIVYVTFGGWQVSVVKNSQAFVTDGTNGLIIYQSGHGLVEGDILTGTVQCTLVSYNGVVELKGVTKTMDGITVTSGTISPVVKTIAEANDLTALNTGLLIKLENVTYNGTAFVDAGSNTIAPYNTFYSYSLTSGQKYNVTGIVQQYQSNSQIYPRKAGDIEALTTIATPTISPDPSVTYTEAQNISIACTTDGATIYYTTDGTDPKTSGTKSAYSAPFQLSASATVKAIANKDEDWSDLATAAYTINIPLPSHDFDVTHKFETGEGFVFPDGWGTSYAEHEIAFTDDKVAFAGASKQNAGATIDDCPVTKNQAISLVLTNTSKIITAVRFDYKQWGTKAQTLTMKYSTDGGANYSDFEPALTATNFAIQALSLPAGVNAIQVTGSNSSNQVGLTSIAFDLANKPVVTKTVTITTPSNGTLVVKNAGVAITSGDAIEVGTTLTIEATPNTGYSLSSISVKDEDEGDVEINAGAFILPSKNVTVSATFVEDVRPAASLKLWENGNEVAYPGDYKQNDHVTLPNSVTHNCYGRVFVGWSTAEIAQTDTKPDYLEPGADFTLSAAGVNNLYAVYAAVATPAGYQKLESDAFETTATYVIGALNGSDEECYFYYYESVDANIWGKMSNDPVTNAPLLFTLSGTTDELVARDAAGNYLKPVSGKFQMSASSQNFVLADDGTITTASLNLRYNSSGDYGLRWYSNTTTGTSAYFYKVVAPTYNKYSTTCDAAIDAPAFDLEEGTYTSAQTITITAAAGATIYYTLDGNDPTTTSDVYSSPIELNEAGEYTLKAFAVKGEAESDITSATYTINLPLTTMDQILAKATLIGGTAAEVTIVFNNWVVSGIGLDEKSVYVTDGTKGFVIYGTEHGFAVNDKLNGSVACNLKLYKNFAEVEGLKADATGLTITHDGEVTPISANIADLGAVNTGAPIILSNVMYNGSVLTDGENTITPYNTFYADAVSSLEENKYYNITGIYVHYNTTKEVAPRSAADIDELTQEAPTMTWYTSNAKEATIAANATYTINLGDAFAPVFETNSTGALTYSSSDDAVAEINETTGALTLKGVTGTTFIKCEVAAAGDYTAGEQGFTLRVREAVAGENVVIVAQYDGKWYAMKNTFTSVKVAASMVVTYADGKIWDLPTADQEAITWVRTVDGDNVTFQAPNGNYLKTSGNDLALEANETGNYQWNWNSTYYRTGVQTRTFMYRDGYNFRSYAVSNAGTSDYSALPVVTAAVFATTPEYEAVRSGLEINRYYTVCLPKKVTAIKGASFWTLNNKSQDGATAYLEEETNNLPFAAGKPFIIQATAENLEVVYEGAATEDAGTNGALHGTLVYMDAAALAAAGGSDVYMLFSNELRPVGNNNHLDANRAYVLLSELNAVAEAPQSAPGRRVRAMPMQPQVATGFEAAEANEAPRKVLINGEFFIIRGEKMYDAKGQLVK